MEPIRQELKNALGISDYEARVYLAVLEFPGAVLTDVAKKADISRTAAYPPIQSLLRRGMLSEVKIGKRKHYHALDPTKLSGILERKKVDLQAVIGKFSEKVLMPNEKLSISYFLGTSGIANASDIFLEETKTKQWYTCEHPEYTLKTVGEAQIDDYTRRRVTRGIRARVILPADMGLSYIRKHLERDKEELRQTIVVSQNLYPIEASIAVTEGLILLIGALDDFFAVLIRSRTLAKTLMSMHTMIWDRYVQK